MKAVIFAGGYGTRLSEETEVRPKPMVYIGRQPILWHIMKIYSACDITDFIICCGYKGEVIKAYFKNYFMYNSDVTFDMRYNQMEVHRSVSEPWRVTLVDTGLDTMTGGRLKRVTDYLEDETFCLTYGDGVSDINIHQLTQFHKDHDVLATLTAVQPPGRYGSFRLDGDEMLVRNFREKPRGDGAWINGGFFVLEPEVIDYIDGDETVWEEEPLEGLALDGELAAYRYDGYWQSMDTLRDKNVLEERWETDKPWKVWGDQPTHVDGKSI